MAGPDAVTLTQFDFAHLPHLVAFLNRVLAGHRHWAAITTADFQERVLDQPAFDPRGLILAWADGQVVGGVHAIRPPPALPIYAEWQPGHHIAWLAVEPAYRQNRVGQRLLTAAENYLYYCPIYFAAQDAPLYGIIEKLWVPWYGSTERMGVSAVHDRELIEWLGRRGYQVHNPGDVSMLATLHETSEPADPGLAERGLCLTPISQHAPWTEDEAHYRLRGWGTNGGREYQGFVVTDLCYGETGRPRAVGSVVWYPLPDGQTAALAWIGLEQRYRGLRFGSYLLDQALVAMARRGYRGVEVHVHTKDNPEAFAMFRRRNFEIIDYWVNLVKT